LAKIVENTTFANVKSKAIEEDAKGDQKAVIFDGGSAGFYFKGTNGRWRDVLTAQDLALYEAAKARVLTPESAKWLEQGGVVPK
ncbi:MAG: aryl sulfotransferase, partial [Dinoroseobacter sp.]